VQELSRREREKLNRRREILQAAWEVFAFKDYDSATLDDIAAAAELSKGTLYLYFQNKAELFFATVEMGVEKSFSIVQEVITSSDDPVAGLKEIIERLLAFFEENVGFFRILFSERAHFEIHAEMGDDNRFKKRLSDIVSGGFRMMADYIQHGIDIDVFRQVDPTDVAFLLMEIIRGFAFGMIHGPAELRLSGKAENIASILLDGIRKQDSVG
jgi:AcrR family transcriptional regulator